jgi:flagellar hook-associated protein 1 FlgK
MSDLLSIGASGVRAFSSALSTTSENIANVGVAGYSRRSVEMTEVAPTSNGISTRSVTSGHGVVVTGTGRAGDAYKTASVRTASTNLARTETGAGWLDRIQSALTGNQLGDRLTGFFTAARGLAADPTSTGARATMLEAGNTAAAAFTATGRALDQVTLDLDSTADQATASLDSLGQALAKVNDGLGRVQPNSPGSAALQDQRDQILDQMSAISDVAVTTDTLGRATVRLGGAQGPALVVGNDAGQVTYARNGDGAVSFAVHRAGEATIVVPSGGALAGIADASQKIRDARASLQGIATDFTTQVNAVQAQGRDLDGNPGKPMFTVAAGAAPTEMTMTLTDPCGIAAASAGGGTRDASNLAALEAARTSGGFETRTTGLIAANAAAIEGRKTVAAAQSAIRDSAITARDAVSGVDLDSEAVDLLRFQQAYQASSRVIQVARETLQSILDIR